jgi:hypothetical protein
MKEMWKKSSYKNCLKKELKSMSLVFVIFAFVVSFVSFENYNVIFEC